MECRRDLFNLEQAPITYSSIFGMYLLLRVAAPLPQEIPVDDDHRPYAQLLVSTAGHACIHACVPLT